jgi:hypothetical protein
VLARLRRRTPTATPTARAAGARVPAEAAAAVAPPGTNPLRPTALAAGLRRDKLAPVEECLGAHKQAVKRTILICSVLFIRSVDDNEVFMLTSIFQAR